MAGASADTTGEDLQAAVVELRAYETFDAFFRREMPGLVAFARVLSGSASADDIAQEAMLAAYRQWDDVSRLDVPGAWVRRVCANRSVSTFRRRAVEARALLRLGSRREATPPLAEEHEAFWSQVRQLSRRQAQVVALHYMDDLGVAEIAATLGCAEGTVKVHLYRGRAALARRILHAPEEPGDHRRAPTPLRPTRVGMPRGTSITPLPCDGCTGPGIVAPTLTVDPQCHVTGITCLGRGSTDWPCRCLSRWPCHQRARGSSCGSGTTAQSMARRLSKRPFLTHTSITPTSAQGAAGLIGQPGLHRPPPLG